MQKPDLDAAVSALLLPDEPFGIDGTYLDGLLERFDKHRANFPRDVAGYMADEQEAAVKAKLLPLLLGHRPSDMRQVLLSIAQEDEDLGRSATLFLWGHEHKLWTASEAELAEARDLAGLSPSPDYALILADLDALEGEVKAHFAKRRAARKLPTAPTEIKEWLAGLAAVNEATNEMRATCADPAAPWFKRLAAIDRWLSALEAAGEGDTAIEFCLTTKLGLAKAHVKRKSQ